MERGSNLGQSDVKPTATFVKTDAKNFKEIVQLLTGLPGQTKSPNVPVLATTTTVASPKRPTTSRNRPKLHIIKPTPYSRPSGFFSDRFTSPSKSRESGSTVPSPRTTPSPRELMGEITLDQKTTGNRPSLQIIPPVPYFGPRNSSFSDLSPSRSSNLVGITSPGLSPTSKFSQLSLMTENIGEPQEIVMVNKEEEYKAVKEGRIYIHPSPRSGQRPVQPELLNLFPLASPREALSDPGASITRAPKSLSL